MACCPFMSYIFWGVLAGGVYALYKYLQHRAEQAKLERWSNTPKDRVILHGFEPGQNVVNASPFVLKVQTYLRMTSIPYEMETKDVFGPKGKAPWISINGQHIADSEHIIEFLNKKFEKNLNSKYSDVEIATANAIRIMLDEHLIWGLALERWVYGGLSRITTAIKLPWYVMYLVGWQVTKRSKGQGVGVHSKEEIEKIMEKDLRIVSTVLGKKKFICGDEPCEADAGIFGELAQCVWGLPDSYYERLVNGDLKNLKEYCERMKERYWKDWDQILMK